MRIKNEVPTKNGMYLFKSRKVNGSFGPCVVIIDNTGIAGKKGVTYALLPGHDGMISVKENSDKDDVQWVGPFTVDNILGIPDNDGHDGEQK